MRHIDALLDEDKDKFQFTHPGRGATEEQTKALAASLVSIHAPREGCDRSESSRETHAVEFQFTHPGRGATTTQIHALGTSVVSIHAPREGCDVFGLNKPNTQLKFQFTHPGRGATPQL